MSDPVTDPAPPLAIAPLHSVRIESFRGIRDLELTLDPRVTVLCGNNAAGKTTVLDAIAIGLGAIVARIPQAAGRRFAKSGGDLRVPYRDRPEVDERAGVPRPFAYVELQSASGLTWGVTKRRNAADRTRYKGQATVGSLHDILDLLVLDALDTPLGQSILPIPLVAAYGTERAVVEVPMIERDFRTGFRRLDAFDESLVARTRFRTVFDWFQTMEDEERRQRERRRDFDYRLPEMQWVRLAVDNAGLRCSNPRVETRPIRLLVDFEHFDGAREPLDMTSLSDGYRTQFALVIDIARRMVQLNPTDDLQDLERGTNSAAIILIDEVDLHLDPIWQARVVQGLQQAFPNAQLVLTTHSEQVLDSVDASCVRRLVWQDGEINTERFQCETDQ